MRLHPTGSATVITGSSAHGQGHATRWSQIVESELGIPFDRRRGPARRHRPVSPYGLGTYGSRSLAVGGHRAAAVVREGARQGAPARRPPARVLRRRPRVGATGSGRSRARPSARRRSRSSRAPPGLANSMPEGMEPNLEATTFFDPPNFTFPFGTHIAEVEIDGETGKVTIERYTRGRRLRQRRQPDDRRRARCTAASPSRSRRRSTRRRSTTTTGRS